MGEVLCHQAVIMHEAPSNVSQFSSALLFLSERFHDIFRIRAIRRSFAPKNEGK
jgi:hypothetical protein